VEKEGERAPVGSWSDNAGRFWTMEARNLFRLSAVTSGDSGRLKLSCSILLSDSFLTSECYFLGDFVILSIVVSPVQLRI
jgi:hypothetical protein